eukprot:2100806-Pyramimonas_sp.AAC.2
MSHLKLKGALTSVYGSFCANNGKGALNPVPMHTKYIQPLARVWYTQDVSIVGERETPAYLCSAVQPVEERDGGVRRLAVISGGEP